MIALFVVYHLLHLTWNLIHPGGASASPYDRVISGFQIWWVTLSYTLALLAVGFHLRHGIWSALANLGRNTSVTRRRHLNLLAIAVASVITVGFLVPPITDQTAPKGPIEERWDTRRFNTQLVNPTNRRRLSVIIVGTGLAGASAAATLGEGGYQVKEFCYEDSPRRAHSIAAQGGINAAKNYRNDGDSI